MALRSESELSIHELGEDALLYPHRFLSQVKQSDTVYCNIDPLAYLLYLAREELGQDFRIVRNVQTGPWNGYLLQEWLCGPLTRQQDVVFYISQYARRAFMEWLPVGSREGRHTVCYPEVFSYPNRGAWPRLEDREYSVAYIGRISRDKGFDIAMEAFEFLSQKDRSSRFLVAGRAHSLDYSRTELEAVKTRGKRFGVVFHPPVCRKDVFSLLMNSRALIFPSTSNVESLGRIVLEACHCETPVVAAAHGEIPRLVSHDAQVAPRYRSGLLMPTGTHFPMGAPSARELVEALSGRIPNVSRMILREREQHWRTFCDLLGTREGETELAEDDPGAVELPPARIHGIPATSERKARRDIEILRRMISGILAGGKRCGAALSELKALTSCPARTNRFVEACRERTPNLEDIGGVSMEACHMVGFAPELLVRHSGADGVDL